MTQIIDSKDIDMEQQILAQATELFLERGFAMTSTVEIARRVGCNQALVHYYFRSKELLFKRVFEEKFRLFSSSFFAIDGNGGTYLERLARKIEAHFDILAANRRLPFLLIGEIASNPDRIATMRKEVGDLSLPVLESAERDLREAIECGEVREVSLLDLIMNIVVLNASTFVALPALKQGFGMTDEQLEEFVANRKKENVITIINGIKI